jgi:SAM-dependent methyltransferase
MKNMYRVTRPAWAVTDKWERAMIFLAGLALAFFGKGESLISRRLARSGLDKELVDWMSIITELLISTLICVFLIWLYKRHQVSCYPSTFFYCFNMPGASNPNGKSQVVGFCCHIKPEMDKGEVVVEGASFFWEDGELDIDNRVGFTSTEVRGTEENGEITCHIRYNINEQDSSKRLYRHGHLQFQLADSQEPSANKKATDVYAGYLRSVQKDRELRDVEVQSKGYAERYRKKRFTEEDMQAVLRTQANLLFGKLDAMLSKRPWPSLWLVNSEESEETNFWGHKIPTPQSIIRSRELKPHIEAFLNKALALVGLGTEAIERFKRFAVTEARRLEFDSLVAYEYELKRHLLGQTSSWKMGATLTQRANIIREQISPFLQGDSLLDIGCGNGLISNLLKDRFKIIQLLDVVQYVTAPIDLPFALYKEGQTLPINQPSYDTVLLLTVLHHSYQPVQLLKLAWAATKKKLIIIESVVGIHQEAQPPVRYNLLKSSDEDQIAYAAFVDWFYNRVLNDDVPVPYNFTKPENWQATFLQNNMHLAQTIHLGQDIDVGPEYHVLFVLER